MTSPIRVTCVLIILMVATTAINGCSMPPAKSDAESAIRTLISRQILAYKPGSVVGDITIEDCKDLGQGEQECVAEVSISPEQSQTVIKTKSIFLIQKIREDWVAKEVNTHRR